MKKIYKSFLLTLNVALILTIIVACDNFDEGETTPRGNLVDVGDFEDGFDLMRDTRTGCVYIKENGTYSYGYTAYYDETGKVAGCGEDNIDKKKYE